MKTIIKFILASFMMLLVVSALGQQQVPLIQKGEKTSILFNKKGNKKLDVEILNVIYSDSTQYSCNVEIKLQLTAIGKKISLFRHVLLENSYYPRLTFSDNINHVEKLANELADGESTTFTIKVYLEDKFFILFDNLYVMRLDQYEGGEIIRQREEEEERIALQQREEIKKREEIKRKAEQQKSDSLNTQYDERRQLLLTPPYLANWVGVNFFTKENIEKDCNVSPVAYHGGAVMYSFPLCGVTMEFEDTHHVCVNLSFRLYGAMGYKMKKDLIEYGYKLQSQSKDLIAENNFRDLQNGKRSIYKCKLENGDYSTCIILEGQAMMFTFFRTKQ